MASPSVLIVEDDIELAKMLREVMSMFSMSAGVAVDGAQAMEQLERSAFDLVMLDMTLPKVSGHQILDFVRVAPHLAGTKVAAMTGNMLLTPGLDEIADYVFIKPFTLVAIEDMLHQIGLIQTPS